MAKERKLSVAINVKDPKNEGGTGMVGRRDRAAIFYRWEFGGLARGFFAKTDGFPWSDLSA